jgi:hypothetical protein
MKTKFGLSAAIAGAATNSSRAAKRIKRIQVHPF